jgi:hypothetical protein
MSVAGHVRGDARAYSDDAAVYDEPFDGYIEWHDYFGQGGNRVMRTLRAIRRRAAGAGVS